MTFHAPDIDYAGISPVIALTVGIVVVLLSAVFKPFKRWAPGLTLLTLAATAGLLIWQWDESKELISHGLRLDGLAITISLIAILTAAFCVFLSIRERAVEEAGSGEYHALLLGSVLGMTLLAQSINLVTFFVAIETLSIPLYILCATNLRREGSLESGLKYLIVGSLGSATLLPGEVVDGRVESPLGEVTLTTAQPSGPVTLVVRAEQVQVSADATSGTKGVVEEVSFFGHDATIRVRVSDDVRVTARVPGTGIPDIGATVTLEVVGPLVGYAGDIR